ncbi:MAG: hypothetical protein L6R48_25290, partial [Planctomycetes bacterium]|nr:hypothetical protein [Planctomycetota bacterium]
MARVYRQEQAQQQGLGAHRRGEVAAVGAGGGRQGVGQQGGGARRASGRGPGQTQQQARLAGLGLAVEAFEGAGVGAPGAGQGQGRHRRGGVVAAPGEGAAALEQAVEQRRRHRLGEAGGVGLGQHPGAIGGGPRPRLVAARPHRQAVLAAHRLQPRASGGDAAGDHRAVAPGGVDRRQQGAQPGQGREPAQGLLGAAVGIGEQLGEGGVEPQARAWRQAGVQAQPERQQFRGGGQLHRPAGLHRQFAAQHLVGPRRAHRQLGVLLAAFLAARHRQAQPPDPGLVAGGEQHPAVLQHRAQRALGLHAHGRGCAALAVDDLDRHPHPVAGGEETRPVALHRQRRA